MWIKGKFFESMNRKVQGPGGYCSGFGLGGSHSKEDCKGFDHFFQLYGNDYPTAKYCKFEIRHGTSASTESVYYEKTANGWVPVIRPDENAGDEPYFVVLCGLCGHRWNPGEQIRPADHVRYPLALRMEEYRNQVCDTGCPTCGEDSPHYAPPKLKRWAKDVQEDVPWSRVNRQVVSPTMMVKEEVILLRLHNHGTFQQGRSSQNSTYIRASGGIGISSSSSLANIEATLKKIFGRKCVHVKAREGRDKAGFGGGLVVELILTEKLADLEARVKVVRKKRYNQTFLLDLKDGTYELAQFLEPSFEGRRGLRVEAVSFLRWRRRGDTGKPVTRWVDPRGKHPGIVEGSEKTACTEAEWSEVGIYIDDPKYLRMSEDEFEEIQ